MFIPLKVKLISNKKLSSKEETLKIRLKIKIKFIILPIDSVINRIGDIIR